MQLCCLHARSVVVGGAREDEQRATGDQPDAPSPDTPAVPTEGAVSDCIYVLVGVDAIDRPGGSVHTQAVEWIRDARDHLSESRVVLCPFPELSTDPAGTTAHEQVTTALAEEIDGVEIRVPAVEPPEIQLDLRSHPFAKQSTAIEPARRYERGSWQLATPSAGVKTLDSSEGREPARVATALSRGSLFRPTTASVLDSFGPALSLWDAETESVLPPGVCCLDTLETLLSDHLSATVPTASRYRLGKGAIEQLLAGTLDISEAHTMRHDEPGKTGQSGVRAFPTVTTVLPEAAGIECCLPTLLERLGGIHELLGTLDLPYTPVIHVSEGLETAENDWLGLLAGTFGQAVPVRTGEQDSAVTVELLVTSEDRILLAPELSLDYREDAGADGAWLCRSRPLGDPLRVPAAIGGTRVETPRVLPLWLAPTQLRLIPIEDAHHQRCRSVAAELTRAGLRVDIDDRDLPVSERLAQADAEWVPFDAVVGDEERDSETLPVTDRHAQREQRLTLPEIRSRLTARGDWPAVPGPVPRERSRQPWRS